MDSRLKIDEPDIFDQPDIRIIDGDRYVLLIFEGTGQRSSIPYMDGKKKRDESD